MPQMPANKGRTVELDPKKFYLIIFDRTAVTRGDAANLQSYLSQQGVQGVSIIVSGDPNKVKIIETAKKNA